MQENIRSPDKVRCLRRSILIGRGKSELLLLFFLSIAAVGSQGCSTGTDQAKKATIDAANLALNEQDCTKAVNTIEPLYQSAQSDNDIRLVAASAYACRAGVNFFQMITNIAAAGSQLAGAAFWSTMAKFFPSTAGRDYILEGSLLATDALQASLNPGSLVLPSFQIHPATNNIGSMFFSDRTTNSNIYLLFIAMATIGSSESRFGSPDADFKKTKYFTWVTADKVDTDGCTYASGIVNFFDAVGGTKDHLSGNLSKVFNNVHEKLAIVIDNSCKIGCLGIPPTGDEQLDPNSVWVSSGCSITTCSKCPSALRDRSKCKGTVNDEVSCAAAGLINFINSSTLGWQGTPPTL